MSIKQFPGGIVTKNPTAPTTSSAPGIWTLDQAMNFVKQGIWPRTPGAPTIGTATAGLGSATVTYTAPSDLGTGTVTFTATSSPGGLTGTGASPITVSGLTGGTSYTFTVQASTPGGSGPASAASNSVAPLAIGDAYGGGFLAGQISTAGNSIADYNLVIGPFASANRTNRQWKTSQTDTAGTNSVINGPANSTVMNNASHPAALWCEAVTAGGFTDWYLPAKNELEVCFYNLKPTTDSNNTSSGINANAVPARASNYTAGTPAQTSATVFQAGGAEEFSGGFWSSTQASATSASRQYFTGNPGSQSDTAKIAYFSVRAVRRVAV
jgi:hypothetical protein